MFSQHMRTVLSFFRGVDCNIQKFQSNFKRCAIGDTEFQGRLREESAPCTQREVVELGLNDIKCNLPN